MYVKIFALVAFGVCVQAQYGGHHGNAYSYATSTVHANGGAGSILHAAPAIHASPYIHAAVVAAPIHAAQEHYVDYHAHPRYNYKYGVEDPHTGDKKTQSESRDGDHTQGEYSLVEPDGTVLTVHYSVVGKSGFNAVVSRSGHAVHPSYHH